MAKQRTKRTETVDEFLQKLDHPMHAEIELVRQIILQADAAITEQIKWNAPSFSYEGTDRITMRLHPPHRLQLVFHRGAKVRDDSQDFSFEDDTGLLQWVTNDRATLTFTSLQEIQAQSAALTQLVARWVRQ